MSYTPPSKYPYLVRMTDPFVMRLSQLSLLIGNTNISAKTASGYNFKGFKVYVSGIGVPVYEESVDSEVTLNGKKYTADGSNLESMIRKAAKEWLDSVEEQIVTSTNDNSIQAAIDTLRWQIHYDITKTSATVPETIIIDKSASATTITDMSSALETSVGTLTDRLAPSGSTVYQSITTVASALKGDSDTYTISRALRESSDASVSNSIKEQTDLIDTEFSNVEDTLGSSSDTPADGSLFGTLNRVDDQIGTDNSETVIQKLNGIDSSTSGVGTDVSSIKSDVTGIKTSIGTASDSSTNTLWYDVLHRVGTRSMPSGAQYQSDSPLGQVKSKTDSMYTGLLGENGALQLASGYDYLTNNSGGACVENSGGNPAVSSKYYMRTESSRFALVYNISGGVSANYAALKSQPAANQNPW